MIDKKDTMILRELKRDGRLSAQEISKKTGIATTTVFNRIKRMEKTGVIKGYTVLADEGRIGRNVAAYVLLTVNYNLGGGRRLSQHELSMKLRRHEFVDEVSIVTGTNDIIIKIRTPDMLQLNEFVTTFLRNIEGIERTQTSVILESF